MSLSVSGILTAAYEPVEHEMLKWAGKKHTWTDPLMQSLEDQGHIHHVNLDNLLDMAGHGGVSDIKVIRIPLTWTKNDELKNNTEGKKIELVKSMLENLINSHDDLFSHKYGHEICKLVIAKDYFRILGETKDLPGAQGYLRMLHTIYAEVNPLAG